VREISKDGSSETWTFVNASLSDLSYQIDLQGSTGISIDGNSEEYNFEVKSFETSSFELVKAEGAVLKFVINNTAEVPLSMQDQFDYITNNTPNLLNLVTQSR